MARVDYEEVAAAYDQARAMELGAIVAWRDAVAPFVEEAPDSPVLDVGAGTGVFALAFAEWFQARVVAVEPSAAMRAKAMSTRAHPRIEYVEGDAARIPLAAGSAGWLGCRPSFITYRISRRARGLYGWRCAPGVQC